MFSPCQTNFLSLIFLFQSSIDLLILRRATAAFRALAEATSAYRESGGAVGAD
jgi:hypothetical protein